MRLETRRRMVNRIMLLLSVLITGVALIFLIWILQTTVGRGITGLNWRVFSDSTPAPGSAGGLANALAGSLCMIFIGVLIGTPMGILAGTFLAEYGIGKRSTEIVRFFNDILLSTPSIITGLFVYSLIVVPLGNFSGLAGGISLAMIVLPIVVRTTDEMLRLVPSSMREAALALGAPRWKTITSVMYRAAAPGILTGVLLALSRISGETAPLLFTALNNQFWSLDMTRPVANLPVVIFQFAMSPYPGWQQLAWTGALIAVTTVLCINLFSRFILARKSKTLK